MENETIFLTDEELEHARRLLSIPMPEEVTLSPSERLIISLQMSQIEALREVINALSKRQRV
jgi:hypothetical protein